MSDYSLQFELAEQDSDQAPALREALKAALPDYGLTLAHHTPEEQPTRFADPTTLAWVAIVLALPSFADASLNLVERTKLKTKLAGLIDWAKNLYASNGTRIRWGLPGDPRKPLDQTRVEEIIDALSRMHDAGRKKKP